MLNGEKELVGGDSYSFFRSLDHPIELYFEGKLQVSLDFAAFEKMLSL